MSLRFWKCEEKKIDSFPLSSAAAAALGLKLLFKECRELKGKVTNLLRWAVKFYFFVDVGGV